MAVLLVVNPLSYVSRAPPFSPCFGLWLGRADLEGGVARTKTGMVVGSGLGLYLSSFLEGWAVLDTYGFLSFILLSSVSRRPWLTSTDLFPEKNFLI